MKILILSDVFINFYKVNKRYHNINILNNIVWSFIHRNYTWNKFYQKFNNDLKICEKVNLFLSKDK